jgi:hypothetical protein
MLLEPGPHQHDFEKWLFRVKGALAFKETQELLVLEIMELPELVVAAAVVVAVELSSLPCTGPWIPSIRLLLSGD